MVKLLARRQRLRSVELKVYTVVHREKKKKSGSCRKKEKKWQKVAVRRKWQETSFQPCTSTLFANLDMGRHSVSLSCVRDEHCREV